MDEHQAWKRTTELEHGTARFEKLEEMANAVREGLPGALAYIRGKGETVWVARDSNGMITGITLEAGSAEEWKRQGRIVSDTDTGVEGPWM